MRKAMRWSFAAALAMALAGCGQSPDDLAITACKTAVAERLTDKTWSVVDDEWKAGYKAGDPGLAEIVAPVYFDKGLPAETTQTVTCRVQFDPNNASAPPSVIGLVFQW
ncbi:MAG: hypothetical protein LW860_13780 [Xanthomonadaceae bacterium]|nr:hypothetical protein [Xanthomonadaceae bacterium]